MSSAAGPLGEKIAATLAGVDFSGVATALGPDGLLAEVALGEADRASHVPNHPATRFAIASVGKLFTAVALVRQLEAGRATLSTRVADVLPPDRRPRTLDERVTIEHLLTHTSGMADYVDEVAGEDFADVWLTWNPGVMRHPVDLLPIYADRPPRAAPGDEVRYNNAAFALLGLVLEAIAGRDYYDVIQRDVLDPAGMTASGFPAIDDVAPGVAIGYLPPDGADGADGGDEAAGADEADGADGADCGWRTNVYAVTARGQPDGGAVATTGDLLRFLDAFSAGELVSPRWRDEMVRPRVHDAVDDDWWGLAFLRLGEGDRARYGHGGSDPGASARLACYPRVGIRVAVLSNVTDGAGPAFRAIEAALIPER